MIPLATAGRRAEGIRTGSFSSRFSHSPCGFENPFLSLRQAISGGRKGRIASRKQYLVQPLRSLYSSGVGASGPPAGSRGTATGSPGSSPSTCDLRSGKAPAPTIRECRPLAGPQATRRRAQRTPDSILEAILRRGRLPCVNRSLRRRRHVALGIAEVELIDHGSIGHESAQNPSARRYRPCLISD